jgi:hypothetical protein
MMLFFALCALANTGRVVQKQSWRICIARASEWASNNEYPCEPTHVAQHKISHFQVSANDSEWKFTAHAPNARPDASAHVHLMGLQSAREM